jgi:hypothetical protein
MGTVPEKVRRLQIGRPPGRQRMMALNYNAVVIHVFGDFGVIRLRDQGRKMLFQNVRAVLRKLPQPLIQHRCADFVGQPPGRLQLLIDRPGSLAPVKCEGFRQRQFGARRCGQFD